MFKPETSERPIATNTFLVPTALVLLGAASAMAALAQYTDLDLWLADLYYNAPLNTFPWNRSWFARDFMHGWVKNFIIAIGVIFIVGALVDLLKPLRFLTPLRRYQLRIIALMAFVEPAFIGIVKSQSAQQCPWAVDRYGGNQPFLRLLDSVPDSWLAGHCFPGGHASTGMWLMALAVLWLPNAPKKALLAYFGGLAIGFALGWVQQMRGQHFFSHTLWTMWFSSALLLALLAVFAKQLQKPSPSNALMLSEGHP